MSYFEDASLVLIPSAVKISKAYSIKPTDGSGDLTFTRSNDTATRIGSDGLIQKVRRNLVLQSNSFDTTWVNTNSTDTGGQADKDGGTTAWLLESTTASGEAYLRQTISASGSNTFSIYAKAGTADFLGVYINATTGIDPYVYFNLSTGAVGTTATTATPSIVSVGSGWYRCSVAYNATIANIDVYVTTADGSFLSTTGDNIVIQASQLESGDIATEPILTTSAAVSVGPVANLPRLDYSGGASCPRLLLEPQRTNSAPYSEQFNLWSDALGCDIFANTEVSPDGYTNADTLTFGANADSRAFQTASFANGTWTFSVYAKSSTGKKFRFRISDASGTQYSSDQTTTSTWQRFTYQFTGAPTTFAITNETAATAGSIFVYAFQAELGAYASSYIPTLGAAVTRGEDNTLTASLSGVLPQTAGTLFWEIDYTLGSTSTMLMHNTGVSDYAFLQIGSSGTAEGGVYESGVVVDRLSYLGLTSGTYKMAFAYETDSFALYVNGVLRDSGTSGSTASISMNTISLDWNSTDFTGVKQVLLFPTRLSNADLAALTA